MIVPYMSIDAFFLAAPFVCRSHKELGTLAWQLSLIVILAAVTFLVYPLELAVARPVADGVFGKHYNAFIALDKPYNLCPSMHIALRAVLAAHFGKHCRGPIRVLMHVWFFLIGCSTLLLYQHHFIDVLGGFVLAIAVMYAVDGQTWKTPVPAVPRLAATYGIAAFLLLLPMLVDSSIGW
jgi:membrane-associated phospholipid phosphatase